MYPKIVSRFSLFSEDIAILSKNTFGEKSIIHFIDLFVVFFFINEKYLDSVSWHFFLGK